MNLSVLYTTIYSKVKPIIQTEKGKKIILILLLVLFLVIVLLSSGKTDAEMNTLPASHSSTYESEAELESRLETLLREVDGVGECRVMVTLEKDNYKIFAKDSYEDKSGNKYEYVTIETESGSDDGLVVNSIMAQVRGVAVVCEGGDSAMVQADVVALVTSVLSINSTQVSVSKMR